MWERNLDIEEAQAIRPKKYIIRFIYHTRDRLSEFTLGQIGLSGCITHRSSSRLLSNVIFQDTIVFVFILLIFKIFLIRHDQLCIALVPLSQVFLAENDQILSAAQTFPIRAQVAQRWPFTVKLEVATCVFGLAGSESANCGHWGARWLFESLRTCDCWMAFPLRFLG